MITVLATNAYKAARAVYSPASKLPKPFNTFPVLACMKLYVKDGRAYVTMAAWDEKLEGLTANTEPISARVEAEFETCIPAKPFVDWLRVTQEKPTRANPHGADQITLDLDPRTQTLKIKAGNTRTEFKCIDAQEWPRITPA